VRRTWMSRLTAVSAWAVAAAAAASLVGTGPGLRAQSRPCTCEDLDAVRAKLRLTQKQIDAYKQVLDEIQSQDPNAATSGKGANERYCAIMGLPPTCTDAGQAAKVNPDTLEPEIPQTFKDANCAIVVDSVDYHERMHPKFWQLNRFNYRVIAGIFGWNYKGGARLQCWNELFAHEEQKSYLEEQLAELERQCQPRIAAYASAADKAAQQQAVAAAAVRVAAYAATIS